MLSQELADIKSELSLYENLNNEFNDLKELSGMAGEDKSAIQEIETKIKIFENKLKAEEEKVLLSGKYDKHDALLSIYAGAGGQDAQDWATMLLRMYQRYCDRKGFKTEVMDISYGEMGAEGRIGTKSATMEIKGKYAYGLLQKEAGVHRLVRISPFNAQSLRQTSFAYIETLPELKDEEEKEIEIKTEDLKIETCKSSGPGGQNVNKRETAIKITHIPTGIIASCQTERMLGDNRKKAMRLLNSRICQLQQETKATELKELKGKKISIEWGNQIRSYVIHPYKLVKDARTGIETSNVEAVLDGDLDEFIEAEIKQLKLCK